MLLFDPARSSAMTAHNKTSEALEGLSTRAMTIKIESETLLRVLESTSSHGSPSVGVCVEFSLPKELDDDTSVATLSTASLSDSDSEIDSPDRRVSFADELVTDVWVRPYTDRSEVESLFYSQQETTRFRQEYRLERKLLNELEISPEALFSEDDLSSLLPPPTESRHSISRVVVLHNDRLETFDEQVPKQFDPCQDDNSFFDHDSFWSGSLTWY